MNSDNFSLGNKRPIIKISVDELLSAYDNFQNWNKVAENLGVSRSTIMRRLRDAKVTISKTYR